MPKGDSGFCGFCGRGGGYLGDQGDERSRYLHSTVRTGTPGNWDYNSHPDALKNNKQLIMWCGTCSDGLTHKYQRHDDLNLKSMLKVFKYWDELDPIRDTSTEVRDDPTIDIDKMHRLDSIKEIQQELERRSATTATT